MRRLLVVLGVLALLALSGGPALADAPFRAGGAGGRPGRCAQRQRVAGRRRARRAAGRGRHAAVRRLRRTASTAPPGRAGPSRPPSCRSSAATTRCIAVAVVDRRVRLLPAAELDRCRSPSCEQLAGRGRGAGVRRGRLRRRAWSPSPTSCAPAGDSGSAGADGGSGGSDGGGALLVVGGDRRGRRRRLPGRPRRGGASARRCPRRSSGWRSPTRTPARPPSSCRAAPATRCSSSTRR